MPTFDYNKVANIAQKNEKYEYTRGVIDKCKPGDPIQLSDCLVNKSNWGGMVLFELGAKNQEDIMNGSTPMMWKIKVLCDEWGNKLGPGDSVYKKVRKTLIKRDGKPVDSSAISTAILDGSYDEKFVTRKKFELDEKGCINCNFDDAVYFLNREGVHAVTGRTLSFKPATSREPLETPNGQKLHCHYWKYREVTAEQYKKLPKLKKRTEPLRGLDDIEEINKYNDSIKLVKEIKTEKERQRIIEAAKAKTEDKKE
jgi:hypothetical protein